VTDQDDWQPDPLAPDHRLHLSALHVVAAAIRIEHGPVLSLPRPARHHDIIRALDASGFPFEQHWEQGFLLSDGRFARRKPARIVAIAAGQFKPDATHHGELLFSEDLW